MPFQKTFHGFIENTTDTLLIIEACRNGLLPTINRRLIEKERTSIKSGTIIVFDESESGIKRWTDGFLWSPSRLLGNFLVYRELANREKREQKQEEEEENNLLQQKERALVGSLTLSNTSYNFKKDGLIKKTIRIMINNGNYFHIICYYNKDDVLNNLLATPSSSPQLSCLQISADLMPHLQGGSHYIQRLPSQQQPVTTATRKRSASDNDQQHYPTPSMIGGYTNNNMLYHRNRSSSSSSSSIILDHYYYSTSETPFTELPPPQPQPQPQPPRQLFQAVTTAKANKHSNNQQHSLLLSPSPSPTTSPPDVIVYDHRYSTSYCDRRNN